MSNAICSVPEQGVPRPWDAQLARRLVAPLVGTRVTPNHLTTVRLAVGLAGAAALIPGTYLWSNVGVLLLVLSNFLDHADGELARISGKSSRFGHWYDLASDAAVTILLFVAMGIGIAANVAATLTVPPEILGLLAGTAVALIFFVRMRIEEMAGKAATRQAAIGGFETEDILYLLPLVSLCGGELTFLVAAAVGAPLFAAWVVIDHRRVARRTKPLDASPSSGAGLA